MNSARRRTLPVLILLLGLLATAAAAWTLAVAERGRQEARFHGLANSAVNSVQTRMLAQLTLLRGTAGYFYAAPSVDAQDFRTFITHLRLDRYYPGVLGIGYAAFAPDEAALQRIVATASSDSTTQLRMWPDGPRQFYSTILYLRPLNRLNRAAIGYDMLSQETRREAMLAAARSGVAQTSGKVRLVQEIEKVKQPGFLIYIPIYRGNRQGPASLANLRGWVYSPLRAYDLFGAIFTEHRLDEIAVEIYDGRVDPDNLLYRSDSEAGAGPRALDRTIDVAGRSWVVRVSPTAQFARNSPYQLAAIVGIAGALISLLVALLVHQQIRAAARTEALVELRTAELSQANRRLSAEAEAREQAESQVRQMQKMEAIGQLTGGIAHDFNNMLAVIIGNLDMAARRLQDSAKVKQAIGNARLGAEKAAQLTHRLLAFGRQQSLAPKAIDINALVKGMAELLQRTLGEDVRLNYSPGTAVWNVYADRTQLENAILNIAINARDAMPDGGALEIATGNCTVEKAEASAGGLDSGDYVAIRLTDTGCGMDDDVARRAIDPFFTTKSVGKGTGLGLSQAYGFARQSHGHLTLQSEVGAGTTVVLYLPRFDGPATEVEPIDRLRECLPGGSESEVILVVEDDDQVREITVETLRELGYAVVSAGHPDQALDYLASDGQATLLLTDVVMPDINGAALAERALEIRPELKVLFATGYSGKTIDDAGTSTGHAVLRKPFSPPELARKVREQLDS